jgi:hypothetical protein
MRKPGMYCSFCGKSSEDVRTLIAGPSVFICNECVAYCNKFLRQESKPTIWLRSLLRLSEPGGLPEAWNQKRNLSSVITAPGPAASYTPYWTSTHSRVPKAPAKSPPGPADSKGSI